MKRLLAAMVQLSLNHPRPLLVLAAVMMAVFGAVGAGTPVDSSRNTMVAADNPHQAKQMRYFERFGIPQSMVFVIEGGSPAERRAVVDGLAEGLADEPALRGRILARVDPEAVAELLLLHRPELATELRGLEGGVRAGIRSAAQRLLAAAPGPLPSATGDPPEEAPAVPPKMGRTAAPPLPPGIGEKLTQLDRLLGAVAAEVDGRDGVATLLAAGGDAESPTPGVDEEDYFVTADGQAHLIVMFPDLPSDQAAAVKPTVDRVRAVRDRVMAVHPEVEASLSGPPVLVVDEQKQIERAIATTSGLTGAGIVVLLLLAFRSLRYALLTLAPVAVGVATTMAVARGIYGELNMVTSSASSVLLALGIDFGVYLLTRYGELVRGGADAREAIEKCVKRAGMGLFIGAITTAAAFLTTTVTEFTAYARLGVVVTVGLVLTMLATLLWMPALLWVAGRGKALRAPELAGMGRLPKLLRQGRVAVLLVAAGLFVAGLVQSRSLAFNTRFYDFLPDEGESAAALLAIERDPVATPLVAQVGVPSMAEARSLATQLEALPEVRQVRSPTDLLPPLDPERREALAKLATAPAPSWGTEAGPVDATALRRTLGTLAAGLRRLPSAVTSSTSILDHLDRLTSALKTSPKETAAAIEAFESRLASMLQRAWSTAAAAGARGHYAVSDLPKPFRVRYGALEGPWVSLDIVPAGDIWEPSVARRFADAVAAVAPAATGLAMHVDAHLRMILDGFTRAALAATGLVFLLLLVAFRRLGDALLAMVPPVLGFSWMLGIMATVGFDLDAANIIILPLIMGLGVDAGVHLVHRMRQSAEERTGVASLSDVVRGTGSAVLLASCTTAIGFASLTLADYGAMTSLGAAMTLGVLTSMLASLVVLPSLMVVLGKAR